jgi:hypothetical protein
VRDQAAVLMVFLIEKEHLMQGSPSAQHVTARAMAAGGEGAGNFGAHD